MTAAKKAPKALKAISKAEVQKHNTLDDAWVMHNGYVYDITAFIQDNKHPGGNSMFEGILGENIEDEMDASDHSPFAYNLIKEYKIGTVIGEKQTEKFPAPTKQMRGYEVDEVQGIVDWSKPLLPQIAVSGDKYWPWIINRPVTDRFEIFTWKFIEDNFSRWPWWIIFPLFVPQLIWNMFKAVTMPEGEGGVSVPMAGVSFAAGLLVWTLMEYTLHRFVFHREVSSNAGNLFHFFAHGVHHLCPADHTRLTFPAPMSLSLAYMFFQMFTAITPAALSHYACYAGFAVGYLAYDTAHYFFHHSDFDNRYFRFCKSAHLGHHYKNEDMNFGVSSPLWDLVFGTYDPYNVSTDNKKVQ